MSSVIQVRWVKISVKSPLSMKQKESLNGLRNFFCCEKISQLPRWVLFYDWFKVEKYPFHTILLPE